MGTGAAVLGDGDLVELHFHGTLDNGEVFDSSRGRRARVFVIGRGQLIPAFEAAIRGMAPGDRTRFQLRPEQAYGARDPARVFQVPRAEAPAVAQPGDLVQLTGGRPATIVRVDDDTVTVDANHPLSGLTLTFEVELLSVRPATR